MILILGGGLAGMSTAYHLGQRPHRVVEAADQPGGLCNSRTIDGYVFDYTGHLLHLRDKRILEWVDELCPDTFDEIERVAQIRSHGATLPFPFQANLHGLPKSVVADCVTGFVESLDRPVPDDSRASFEEWSLAVFGRGISDAFMLPYNEKLFRRAPAKMTADWVSWAVPRPTLNEVVQGALGIENRGMGYNSKFRYPRDGGIGVLPAALAKRVQHMRTGYRVESINLAERSARFSNGESIRFDSLVVTIPLPTFLGMLEGAADDLTAERHRLDWSVVECLNLGVRRPELADGAHWMYFPDADAPFYRVGFPSNFSSTVAPKDCSSMYVEFGTRRGESFDRETMERQTLQALRREGILAESDEIPVRNWIRIDPGYVIFDSDRQEVMRRVVPELEEQGVHLIGRYGAWTYSYMERALLDGLELAERLGD